ncbi:ATP-binding protein [Streptomyces sp. ODS28]|uniref:ATP-binding protein n=1 Tax=Streptomyces sp. ODS28 TaxID=3136688 RepID=UPI0031E5394F
MTQFSSSSQTDPASERGVRREDFELPASAAAVSQARERVYGQLKRWNLPEDLGHSAQLVISEFFTNAVVHTESEQVRCRLRAQDGRLRIEVTDEGSEGEVAARHADEESLNGRGLHLVSAVAEKWGVLNGTGPLGRVVWAELRG